MKTFVTICVLLATVGFTVWGYAGYEIGPLCHPDHQCSTDAECADEEAYFLDLDELHQSDDENIEEETAK